MGSVDGSVGVLRLSLVFGPLELVDGEVARTGVVSSGVVLPNVVTA